MSYSQDRLMLPWTVERKENNQFTAILAILLTLLIVLAVWIPTIDLPEPDRETLEKLPPQLAKLVVKKEPPKPPAKEPVKKKEEPKKEPEKQKEPEKKAPPKPKPEKKKEAKPAPPKATKQEIKKAREVARKTGLLALQSDLAELRTAVDTSSLKKKSTLRKEKTIAAKATSTSAASAFKSSGGINTGDLAAPAESVALAARETERLDETADEKDLAFAEAEAALKARVRSEESIRLAIESLKKTLYKLYNRELRKDPFLEGVVLFEVVIEASGEVSYCRIKESELNNKGLENKFVNRFKLFNFGAEDVSRTTQEFSINFIPQ